MRVKQPKQVITCPHCGWQYLASEIFYPNDFLGKPDSVVRDALGKIIYEDYWEDEEPCFTEHYECDNCNKPFVIDAIITYKAKPESEENDFSDVSVSLLD